jgi:hypothetical protein
MKQDHWHGFEIAPARSTTQTHHELGEFVSTGRDHCRRHLRMRSSTGKHGRTGGQRKTEESRASRMINGHSALISQHGPH